MSAETVARAKNRKVPAVNAVIAQAVIDLQVALRENAETALLAHEQVRSNPGHARSHYSFSKLDRTRDRVDAARLILDSLLLEGD